MGERIAVVLFNLGGPDSLDAVEPFLRNLFGDPAILSVPRPWRGWLAKFLARRRAPVARDIYRQMGGRSPILAYTRDQAAALEGRLRAAGLDARVFVAMRYWHPMSRETATAVQEDRPARVVLLPLYPQYSTTTTGSSVADWLDCAAATGMIVPTVTVCCYPTNRGLVLAIARLIEEGLRSLPNGSRPRILFSAHGLPERVIARGDPYQWQVEQTAAAVVGHLKRADLEWRVCYQSRVGPLRWIGPSTEEELKRAAADKVAAIVVPIAFVSEHSETLVELDIEYRRLAEQLGVPTYIRIGTVGTAPEFIEGLAEVVIRALEKPSGTVSGSGGRLCPQAIPGARAGAVVACGCDR
jgi:ferrochelatase